MPASTSASDTSQKSRIGTFARATRLAPCPHVPRTQHHRGLAQVAEPWQPHRLTSVNDYDVKVVKLEGEFVWHSHPETDELFLVIRGELVIQLRDGDVVLGPLDTLVVPKGVEHCPRADGEVHAVLIEPQGTMNTGDAGGDRTSPIREFG